MKRVFLTIFMLILLLCTLAACKTPAVSITFIVDDQIIHSAEVKKGEAIPDYAPPEKEGHIFEGWFFDKDYSQPLTASAKAEKSITLYAKYSIKIFTVTFKVEGGEDIIRKVEYNKTLTDIPAVPQKTGHTATWDITDFSNIKSDLTVTAIYAPIELTITFKIEGQEDIIRKVLYGQALTDIPQVPQKTGKTGYWDRQDFSSFTQDTVINAVYEDKTITITFISELNGHRHVETRTVTYGQSLAREDIPQPHSYEGHTGVWENADLSSLVEDIEVRAIYTPFIYNLRFLHQDTDITLKIPYGAKPYDYISQKTYQELELESEDMRQNLLSPPLPVELDNPEKRNPRFGNFSGDMYDELTADNQVYKVIWDYFVILHTNGGEIIDSMDYPANQEFAVPNNSLLDYPELKERLGYKFHGWYLEEEGITEYLFINAINEDIEVYALWEEIFCEVSFPDIDGITFIHDYADKLKYGSEFSFSIQLEGEISEGYILEVMANDATLTPIANNEYKIEYISEDINIAVKTEDIDIHKLVFYNEQGNILYVRNISHGQLLKSVPSVPEMPIAVGIWIYDGEEFDFTQSPITEDMDFYADYTYSSYHINFYLDGFIWRTLQVEYQDPSFEFISPDSSEYKLFEGWYIDQNLSYRATKEYIINIARPVNLYPKWVDKTSVSHEIVGIWYDDLFIMEFRSDGEVRINDFNFTLQNEYYRFQSSFRIIDNIIHFHDQTAEYDGVNIIYRGRTLQRSCEQKSVVRLAYDKGTRLIMIDNYSLPYEEELWRYYWYAHPEYEQPVDINNPLSPSLFENKLLTLYGSVNKYVQISFNAKGGATQGNLTHQKLYITPEGNLSEDIITCFMEGYTFWGWAVEGSDHIAVDANYLYYCDCYTVNAYAVYALAQSMDNPIEGAYVAQSGENVYIAVFEYFEDRGHAYVVFKIDLTENSFVRTLPLTYSWNEQEQSFIDANGAAIILDASSIAMTFDGAQMDFYLNESHFNDEHTVFVYVDSQQNELLLNFDFEHNTVTVDDNTYAVYRNGGAIIFFEDLGEYGVKTLRLIDISELAPAISTIPQEYIGVYTGTIPIEENVTLYVRLEIINTSDVKLQLYDNPEYSGQPLIEKIRDKFMEKNGYYFFISDPNSAFYHDLETDKFYMLAGQELHELTKTE